MLNNQNFDDIIFSPSKNSFDRWDLQNKNYVFSLNDFSCLVKALCFIPPGKSSRCMEGVIVGRSTTDDNFAMFVWFCHRSGVFETMSAFNGHADVITDICLMKNDIVASSSRDGTIRIWDLFNVKCINVIYGGFSKNEDGKITRLDNNHLIFFSKGEIRIWNIATGDCEYHPYNDSTLSQKLYSHSAECDQQSPLSIGYYSPQLLGQQLLELDRCQAYLDSARARRSAEQIDSCHQQ